MRREKERKNIIQEIVREQEQRRKDKTKPLQGLSERSPNLYENLSRFYKIPPTPLQDPINHNRSQKLKQK